MPKRKRSSKKGYKRGNRKYRKHGKRRRFGRSGRLNPGPSILPQALRVKHKFTQEYELNDTDGLGRWQVFRANSLFDPDYTGAGTQPRLHDQMAEMYKYYTVLGCKVRVRYHVVRAGTTNSDDQGFIGFHWYPDGGGLTIGSSAIKEYGEQDGTSYRPLSGALNNGEMSNGRFKRYLSMNKIFKRNVYQDPEYEAASGSNPNSRYVAYFSTACFKDVAATRLQVRFYVDLTYYSVWRIPKDIPDS